jgi:hypothetical protein
MKKKDLPIRTQELLDQLTYLTAAVRAENKECYNPQSRAKFKEFILTQKDSFKLIHAMTYNFKKNCFVIHFLKEDCTWINTEF